MIVNFSDTGGERIPDSSVGLIKLSTRILSSFIIYLAGNGVFRSYPTVISCRTHATLQTTPFAPQRTLIPSYQVSHQDNNVFRYSF